MTTPVRAHAWSPLTGRGLALGLALAAVGAVGPLAFRFAFGALEAHDGCGPHPTRSADYCDLMFRDLHISEGFMAGLVMIGAYVLGFTVVFTAFSLLGRWTGRREDPDVWWNLLVRTLAVWLAGGGVFLIAALAGFGNDGRAPAYLFWLLLAGTLVVLAGLAVLGATRVSLLRTRLALVTLILLLGTAVPLVHPPTTLFDGWSILGAYAGWVLAVAVAATAYGPARPAPSILRA